MKKGFMFYFAFLLLLVFGVAMVLMVILLCSPGTEIFGLKYFKSGETYICETTTDDSKTLLEVGKTGKYSEIKIDAGYATVRVEHSTAYPKDSVVIVNDARGFVRAKDEVKFKYSVLVDGSVLNIKVTEPNGFLHFSKNVKVIVHVANKTANPFGSTKFTIKTDSGNIEFGGDTESPYVYDLNIGAINLKTKSGNIQFGTTINYNKDTKVQTFSSATLNFGSGNYKSQANSLKVTGDLNLISTSGKFAVSNVQAGGNINIKTESSTYEVKKMTANNVNVECKNGYFYINEIASNLKFPNADEKVDSPYLKSNKITGDLTVVSGNNFNMDVKNIEGNVTISNTSGNITIGSGKNTGIKGAAVITTKSGNIKAYIQDGNDKVKQFTTDSGEVKLYLLGQVKETTIVNTKSGKTKVNFLTGKSYSFEFTNKSNNNAFDMKRVTFKDFPNTTMTNPYIYNPEAAERGAIEIHTDSKVELALFTA